MLLKLFKGLSIALYVYIDDLLIASSNVDEHYQHLTLLFQRLSDNGIVVNPDKCELGKREIIFLGHVIKQEGILPCEDKVQAIKEYNVPSSLKELKAFLGLVNFYRRFIPHAAERLRPLTDLLRGNPRRLEMNDSARTAFTEIKTALAQATLLAHPDPSATLSIAVDASDVAIGAVMQQNISGSWQPLEFFSRRLTTTETRYSAFGRELLAAYCAIKHFRHAVEGRRFILFTDHKPLTYALHTKSDRYSPRECRHLDYISQFTTDLRHIQGKSNCVADALSRIQMNAVTLPVLDLPAMAAAQANDPSCTEAPHSTSLQYQEVPLATTSGTILCDTSTGLPRLIVPSAYRRLVFDALHGLSHPGIAATLRLIAARYVWPSMNKDVRMWAKQCLQCQRSKVHRHVAAPLGTFATPDARFDHVHLDIVGPLPPSHGYDHILTCIDRFTRWPEAIPITSVTAETVAHRFVERWIALYGCPSTVTTDRGQQFESALFSSLTRLLGTERIRTTAYHPASNGLVERFHRQLKSALRAHENDDWYETLPLVLLGIRKSLKADIQCSAAELVYGTTLRLPGEFFTPRSRPNFGKSDYVHRLSAFMRTLSPVSTRIQHRQVALPRELSTCSHVFIRVDSVRKPLQQPYEGPFRVIARHEKTFKVDRHGRVEIVSIDRLKPAHVDDSALSDNLRFNARPSKPTSGILKSSTGPTLDTSETSFSRPSQQHASSAPSTDETTVSRPDQQTTPPLTSDEIAGSRDANETAVSRSGRRVRLPVRFREQSHSQLPIRCRIIPILHVCYTLLFLIFFLFPEPTPSTILVWFRRLQSTLAKAGLITHALVNALSRYIGFECLVTNLVVTVASGLLAQRCFVLRLQRFWCAPLRTPSSNSGYKPLWCSMPTQATNTTHRSWYRSPITTFVGNSTINDRFPVRQFFRPTIAHQPISPTIQTAIYRKCKPFLAGGSCSDSRLSREHDWFNKNNYYYNQLYQCLF
ncbi:unnamed protein product [Schistosoma bovis]|nr:unnamed protein product [Schistosoma bovis]